MKYSRLGRHRYSVGTQITLPRKLRNRAMSQLRPLGYTAISLACTYIEGWKNLRFNEKKKKTTKNDSVLYNSEQLLLEEMYLFRVMVRTAEGRLRKQLRFRR